MTDRFARELQICLVFEPELFIDSKRWDIVKEISQHKIMNFNLSPPSESKNRQDLRINKAEVQAGEANINPIISSERKIWPHEYLSVTTSESVAARENQVNS